MEKYIEIKIISNNDVGLGFLWKKIYTQLHIMLVESKENIGISFVNYKEPIFPLGDTLRLFGNNEKSLASLNVEKWLVRLKDYCCISSINDIPSNINEYACFYRKQCKTGIERHARRYAKRHNIHYEEALQKYSNTDSEVLKLPFIMLFSPSSRQDMKLFIQRESKNKPNTSNFNSHGLSKDATVPIF
jgi:CRISPR-associated endonuclease Csy4